MKKTIGVHHVGFAVADLNETTKFFQEGLGFDVLGEKPDYPAKFVSDGNIMVTLWQTEEGATPFDRRKNIGSHHLALKVESREALDDVYNTVKDYPGASIEFSPELLGNGPRMHMMCNEPGGIRIEFIWMGE